MTQVVDVEKGRDESRQGTNKRKKMRSRNEKERGRWISQDGD
jgi:hypothetical protein